MPNIDFLTLDDSLSAVSPPNVDIDPEIKTLISNMLLNGRKELRIMFNQLHVTV